ncbi:ABC transporter ATP-binding protein [Oceanirhabdus sp. W0125-5]|uniref:ABC transporter ATP-binding protein n=1 Tax=Oceanirhabdus sp. W0125-5 TaxID=2999116 RepID=UPI0022F2FC58|nr:ABC transporter ATP-binding protein [Oceanirhabdus sp. W0125-5]WBW97290.1 ABC transporter ATP-binding protein [Oceanirhabdus sp. W0125-5]
MLKYVLKKFKAMSLFYVLNGIIQILAASLSVVYLQKLIDKLPEANSYNEVITIIIVYGVLLLVDCLLSYLDEYPYRMLSNGIYHELKILALKKISKIDYVSYQGKGTGSLVQLIEAGAMAGKNILFDFYMNLFRNILPGIIISLILIGTYNLEIMAVIFIGYVVIFFISNILMKYLYKIKDKILTSEEWLSKHFIRGFMELVVFRLNKRYETEINKIEQRSNSVVKSKTKIRMIHELFFTLFALIIIIIKLIILFIGVGQVVKGDISVGAIIALITFVDRIYSPIAILNVIFIDYKLDKVAFKRLEDFMNLPDDINLRKGSPIQVKEGKIEFKNVSFDYNNVPILNNLSLCIEGNSSTAFVGSSGAGKSTIIKMILGLLKPTKGDLYVDDSNLSKVLLDDYYDDVSYVSQDAPIFDGTLRENIVFDEDISDDEIYEILDQVQLKDFVMRLPHKLYTEVGEKGVKLSGGEKQRLAFARVFFQKSKIVILDEATSALDSINENLITNNLLKKCKDKTIIIIAHRLHTIKNVDNILVIDDGKLAESGSFESLLAKDGLFKKLWDCQVKDHETELLNS